MNQLKDRSLLPITSIVIFLHCLFLVSLFFCSSSEKKTPSLPPPRLVVQTIALNSPKPQVALPINQSIKPEKKIEEEKVASLETASSKIEVLQEVDPLPIESPPIIKPIAPPKQVQKVVPKPVAVPKKNILVPERKVTPLKSMTVIKPKPEAKPKNVPPTPPKASAETIAKQQAIEQEKIEATAAAHEALKQRQKLVADAQKNLAKINHSTKPSTAHANRQENSVLMPHAVTSLHVESAPSSSGIQLSDKEANYLNELSNRLQLQLRFPDYGEVKVELTIDRSGKITKMLVVEAKSLANRKYIEKTLPGLSFPSFGSRFSEEATHTFVIILCNEL